MTPLQPPPDLPVTRPVTILGVPARGRAATVSRMMIGIPHTGSATLMLHLYEPDPRVADTSPIGGVRSQLHALLLPDSSACDDGRPLPNRTAFDLAEKVVDVFDYTGALPTFVHASPEGGYLFSFVQDERHAAVEVYNEGEIVFVISHLDRESEVFETSDDDTELTDAVRRIQEYLL